MGKILYALFFVFAYLSAYGQDHSSIVQQWSSNQTTNPGNVLVNEKTTLALKGRDKMEWKNPNGTIRKSFMVIEIVGTEPTKDGDEKRLEIVSDNKRGFIKIAKVSGKLSADITINYQQPEIYKLQLEKL